MIWYIVWAVVFGPLVAALMAVEFTVSYALVDHFAAELVYKLQERLNK